MWTNLCAFFWGFGDSQLRNISILLLLSRSSEFYPQQTALPIRPEQLPGGHLKQLVTRERRVARNFKRYDVCRVQALGTRHLEDVRFTRCERQVRSLGIITNSAGYNAWWDLYDEHIAKVSFTVQHSRVPLWSLRSAAVVLGVLQVVQSLNAHINVNPCACIYVCIRVFCFQFGITKVLELRNLPGVMCAIS